MNEQDDRPLVPSEDFWNIIMVWVDPHAADQFIELSRLSRAHDDQTYPAPQMTVVMHEKPPRLDRAA